MQIISKYFVIILIIYVLEISSFNIDFKALKEYLFNEKTILDSFDKYLTSEEHRISRLRRIYEHFRKENTISSKDKDLLLSHPNDIYFLIKRITHDWKVVEELLEPNKKTLKQFEQDKHQGNLNKFNLNDAVKGYEDLVYFFELDMSSAVNGVITYNRSGKQKVFKSLSNQNPEPRKQSYRTNNMHSSKEWLTLALKLTDNETSPQLIADISDYLSLTEYRLGNIERGVEVLKKSLKLSRDRPLAWAFLRDIEATKVRINKSIENNQVHQNTTYEQVMLNITDQNPQEYNQTEQEQFMINEENNNNLCLGRNSLNDSIKSKLKCFHLNTTSKPYLRFHRIKVEELYKRPQILLIHNFLSETESETLKNLTEPKMLPS